MKKTPVLLSIFTILGVFIAVFQVNNFNYFLGSITNNFIPKTTLEYWLENAKNNG